MSSVERTISISTHAPRTGSDRYASFNSSSARHFNPRSPHGERHQCELLGLFAGDFNPRSPHGERLRPTWGVLDELHISTHAPRTGSDDAPHTDADAVLLENFNPRSPHGERPYTIARRCADKRFQPTLPARGATNDPRWDHLKTSISTHAPRTGSDDELTAFIC